MVEVQPVPVDVDALARRVFLKALEIAGGTRKLIQHRNLTWVPSLIEAAYVVVLHEEFKKSDDEIAQFLGVGSQTVRNILRASPEGVLERLEGERGEAELKTHIAGGLAKLAYQELKKAPTDYDALALEVALKAIEVAGGMRKLVHYRNLTWVPSLIEAAYVVVLHEEARKTPEEIAAELGITRQTVENVLRADPKGVLERLEGERGEAELKTHIAGGLARLAYQALKGQPVPAPAS